MLNSNFQTKMREKLPLYHLVYNWQPRAPVVVYSFSEFKKKNCFPSPSLPLNILLMHLKLQNIWFIFTAFAESANQIIFEFGIKLHIWACYKLQMYVRRFHIQWNVPYPSPVYSDILLNPTFFPGPPFESCNTGCTVHRF